MKAIDMHVHVPRQPGLPSSLLEQTLRDYFRLKGVPDDVEQMAEKYREWDLLGVLLSIDSETTTGDTPDSNDYIAGIVDRYPGQFIGFAAIDPWKGAKGVEELDRAVNELGLSGLKLHPTHQSFYPNDHQFYPFYEKCSDLGVPVLFHSGMAASGSGTPGGGGTQAQIQRTHPGDRRRCRRFS